MDTPNSRGKRTYHIQIEKGMEHHSKLMNIYDKDDLFYDAYCQAAYAITRIVERSRAEQQKNYAHQWYENCYRQFEYHNNIVSFCADRGQGKTSAMLSVAEALQTMQTRTQEKEQRAFWNQQMKDNRDNPVLSVHFECLPVSDPNSLEKNTSILRTVMSKMFKAASENWESAANNLSSRQHDEKRQKKEQLAEQFLKCFKGLDFLYKEKKEIASYYDDLNMAAEYGDSNNMKDAFMKLVRYYLDFMADDHKDAMLVILVDDADLNIEQAYYIVEEIRKYFVMPGVIVLAAMHIGTLSRTLEQHFMEQYKTLMAYKQDIRERCHSAMERYITKLLPAAHRIYLPAITGVFEQSYNRLLLSYTEQESGGDRPASSDRADKAAYGYLLKSSLYNPFPDNYETRLFCLIYAKTGIILTQQGNFLHEFLPNNFRHLNHFLFYMNSLPTLVPEEKTDKEHSYDLFGNIFGDIRKGDAGRIRAKETAECWLDNLLGFLHYFLNIWCPERLTDDQLGAIEKIDLSPLPMKNMTAVQQIRNILNKCRDVGAPIEDLREQKRENTQYTPFSDVVWALNRLSFSVSQRNQLTFISAVKMYYTILLHITALKSILSYLEKSDRWPFSAFYDLLGGRIFPMHYYLNNRLPFYLFSIEADKLFKTNSPYAPLLRFLRPCFTDASGVIRVVYSDGLNGYIYGGSYTVDFRLSGWRDYALAEKQLFDFMAPLVTLFEWDEFETYLTTMTSANAFSGLLHLVCNLDLQEVIYKGFFCDRYSVVSDDLSNLVKMIKHDPPDSAQHIDIGFLLHDLYTHFNMLLSEAVCLKTDKFSFGSLLSNMVPDVTITGRELALSSQYIKGKIKVEEGSIPAIFIIPKEKETTTEQSAPTDSPANPPPQQPEARTESHPAEEKETTSEPLGEVSSNLAEIEDRANNTENGQEKPTT